MKMRHRLLVSSLAAFSVNLLSPQVAVVSAAAPSNDDPAGAVAVPAIPYATSQDTTEATTSAEETAINATFCGAPALEHGVWYTYTAPADGYVVIDVSGSNFAAGIFAATGSPGSWNPQTCAPTAAAAFVGAGETLYVLLFGDGTGGPTSGNLVVDIHAASPPPTVALTVDPVGYVNRQGVARIGGTLTCASESGTAALLEIFGQLRQTVGRFYIDGFFDMFTEGSVCDGTPQRWAADVVGNGKFAGGKAASLTLAFACGDVFCSDAYVESVIQLRRSGR